MRRLATSIAAFTLSAVLVACGGTDEASSDAGRSAQERFERMRDEAADRQGDDEGDDPSGADGSGGTTEAQPPTFLLTGALDPAAGWTEVPSDCASPDGESGPPFFTYFVPEGWERRSSSYGGGGGVGGTGTQGFITSPDERDETVSIEVDEDNYGKVGGEFQVLDVDQQGPWTSFDYTIESFSSSGGESVETITYGELDPVEIDGETFELFALDQDQSDQVGASEYKVRVVWGELPAGGITGGDRTPASATVTVAWDAENTDFTETDAREILETFRVPTCAQEAITDLHETINGADWSD